MHRIVLIFFLFLCSSLSLFAQNKQGNIWYFGINAGLDFNTEPPTKLLNGKLNTWEGCATIADKNGQLLFYTDGITVWDKNHTPMPNGQGLNGDPSSTQSGIIVPKPGDENLFYVFTVANYGVSVDYSIIDIRLNNGSGDVIEKNINIQKDATEKITATLHSNGKHVWILTHGWENNNFYSYLLTENGLNSAPVISAVGSIHDGKLSPNPVFGYTGFEGAEASTIGYMKFSLNSEFLAVAVFNVSNFVEQFKFDNRTGKLQFLSKTTRFNFSGPYGLEYSPNNQFLYISERVSRSTSVYQVEVKNANGPIDSVGFKLATGKLFGALQIAPNGKIYLARDLSTKLGVINKPNERGVKANFVLDGLRLTESNYPLSALGLPNLIPTFFNSINFGVEYLCENDLTQFEIVSSPDVLDSVKWEFTLNETLLVQSKDPKPEIQFIEAGQYYGRLVGYTNGDSVEIRKPIRILPQPDIELNNDTLVNIDKNLIYQFDNANDTFLWNDGDNQSYKTINSPGWHWVEATTEQGCTKRDSVALFKVNYADTCMLSNTSFELLSGNIDVDSVTWQVDGNLLKGEAVNNVFSSSGTKNITANIYYNNTSLSQGFQVEIPALPNVDLGNDRTLFYGETLELDVSLSGTSFLWQDGSTSPTLTVDSPGTYWVDVTNASGCVQRDSLVITYDQVIDVALPDDATLCLGETLNLDVSLPDATYRWQDGSTAPDFNVSQEGTYWVEITNAFGNRTKIDSITVDYYEFNEMEIEAEVVICEESDVALSVTGGRSNETYLWYDENMRLLEENQGLFTTSMLNTSTDFFVTTSNGTCESDPVRVSVIYDEVFAEITASDTITKLGEPIELFGFGGESFEWSPPMWLNNPNTQNPIANPEDDIEYTLTVTSARGCTDSETILLLVEKRINIPNVITPNGDGLNDFWEVQFIDRFPGSKVQIFDRRGSLLYEAVNYQNNWNGTANGQELPTGTYFYKIDLNDPEFPIEKGSLTILRKKNE